MFTVSVRREAAAAADLSSGINDGSQPHHLFCINWCHTDVHDAAGGNVGSEAGDSCPVQYVLHSSCMLSLKVKLVCSLLPVLQRAHSVCPLQGRSSSATDDCFYKNTALKKAENKRLKNIVFRV